VAEGTTDGTAVVRTRGDKAEISLQERTVVIPSDPTTDAPGWHGLRRLAIQCDGLMLKVHLDDLDPFRDQHRLRATPRLNASQTQAWMRCLTAAWEILALRHREHAEAMAVGLRVIVPLALQGGHRGISATVMDALGSVAMSLQEDPPLLAEGLIHEFQHAKLGALLSMIQLYKDAGGLFYAPWRDDPRPLGGLLQGTYAYLGVTSFWQRELALKTVDDVRFGEFQLALWREQTSRALDAVLRSGRLTSLGRRFVTHMGTALRPSQQIPIHPEACELAADAAIDHALIWRLRHVRPDPELVQRLAEAWIAGDPRPPMEASSTTLSTAGPGEPAGRAELRLGHLRAHSDKESTATYSAATAADLIYFEQGPSDSLAAYRAQVNANPDSTEGWAGLFLSLRNPAVTQISADQPAYPEVVAALHQRVRRITGSAPDALDLTTWLGVGPGL
jgi:hypothetical protein